MINNPKNQDISILIQAEQSVLGSLVIDHEAWDRVDLNSHDFLEVKHRLIFDALCLMREQEDTIDVVTLAYKLDSMNQLESAGGFKYLGRLIADTPTSVNVSSYASIVSEASLRRQIAKYGLLVAESASGRNEATSSDLLVQAEDMLLSLSDGKKNEQSSVIHVKGYISQVIENVQILYESESEITGISTGYSDLDLMTSGLQKTDFIIVAARPSMGKTTFAMNIAEYASVHEGKTVLVFSLEMSGEQLTLRMMSSIGKIDQQRLRSGQLNDDDWPRVTSATVQLASSSIFIDDTPALSPSEIRSRARGCKARFGLDMIVIDYMQLLQSDNPSKGGNRVNEISEISRKLKALAKELDVPVVALSQLNRSLEQRQNKRPIMSDLRESGAIEQDADLIAFIYRDEVYNPETDQKGVAEIIIGKQRNGPTGTSRLVFNGKYNRFENYSSQPSMQ